MKVSRGPRRASWRVIFRNAPYLEDRREELNGTDRDRLERLKTQLIEDGLPGSKSSSWMACPKSIIAQARPPASLVVLGSQGRGFTAELFLGSESLAVVRHAETPILVVPAAR